MGLKYVDDKGETADFLMASYMDLKLKQSNRVRAHVRRAYVEVSQVDVKPNLEFIVQQMENCVKEKAGLSSRAKFIESQ